MRQSSDQVKEMTSNRKAVHILVIAFIQLFSILMISHNVFAEEPALPVPYPGESPGEMEAVYYSVLKDKIKQYGIGIDEYFWETHYSEETGVVWAQVLDLAGDGNSVLAIIYDQEPENSEEYSWMLEIYKCENDSPICICTQSLSQNPSWQTSEIEGSLCLQVYDNEGTQKLLTIKDGELVDIAPYETEQEWRGCRYTAYLDEQGDYHCICTDLADTIEKLSGVGIGSMNPDNTDWTKLYAAYINDLIDYDSDDYKSRYSLYDVDGDGIRELFVYPLNPMVASSEDESGSVVTADTDCIRILEFRALGIMAGNGIISVPGHISGLAETQKVFTLTNHRFSLDQILEMYAPGGFGSGETRYRVDGTTEISQEEYEAKMEAVRQMVHSIFSGWYGDEYDSEGESFDRESILDYLNSSTGKRGLNNGNTGQDDYSSLIGLQVPGSERCIDMNSGYAFAIRNLIELYGLAQYNLEDNVFSDWPATNGVCWAGMLSKNSESVPYLAIVRFDYDSLEEFYQYHVYVYSWEGGKLILKNWFTSQGYWVSNLNGNVVFINAFDDGYGVFPLDNGIPVQYYMPCDDENEYSDDEYDAYSSRYQIGQAIGDYDDYLEAEVYLKTCRIDLHSMRYYTSSDEKLYGISSNVEDLYLQMSGEAGLPNHSGRQLPWKELYQQIIRLAGENTGIRYSLVYLDADEIPELLIKDYSQGSVGIVTSNGVTVDSLYYIEDTIMEAADRLGCILLLSKIGYDEEEGKTASVISLSGGRFDLRACGGYSSSGSLYVWSGIRLGAGEEGDSLYQAKLNQAIQITILLIIRPKYDPEGVLHLLNALESGVVLTVSDSWTEEEELAFREQLDSFWDIDSNPDESTDGEEADEYNDDYDEGTPYVGPADLADAQSDWRAVNEAELASGDPVTVPGDFYMDGQERYKETGYILPQSATQYLTEEDIAHLTMKGCCYARNEIYARHGRLFNASELENYFNSRSWYEGTVSPDSFDESFTQSVFNEYEYANAYFLLKYEEEHGMYWPE